MSFQEKKIGTESNIDVSLAAAEKSMEEVVVIGYGTQKQKNITGSVATISPKKLEDLPVSSLTEMLRGKCRA
jgi:outer membrane receptor for Fe3+-dicitrate